MGVEVSLACMATMSSFRVASFCHVSLKHGWKGTSKIFATLPGFSFGSKSIRQKQYQSSCRFQGGTHCTTCFHGHTPAIAWEIRNFTAAKINICSNYPLFTSSSPREILIRCVKICHAQSHWITRRKMDRSPKFKVFRIQVSISVCSSVFIWIGWWFLVCCILVLPGVQLRSTVMLFQMKVHQALGDNSEKRNLCSSFAPRWAVTSKEETETLSRMNDSNLCGYCISLSAGEWRYLHIWIV